MGHHDFGRIKLKGVFFSCFIVIKFEFYYCIILHYKSPDKISIIALKVEFITSIKHFIASTVNLIMEINLKNFSGGRLFRTPN